MSTTVPGPASRDSHTRFTNREIWRGSTLAFFAWVIAVFDYILFGTLLPVIQKDFGWTEAEALLASTGVTLGAAVIVLAVGPIVDRIGRRRGMLLTVGGTAISSGLTALSSGVATLIGFRALSGLGLSEQTVNATYLTEIYDEAASAKVRRNRGFFYGIVQSGWPVGALVAALFVYIVGLVAGDGQWRWMFALATIPGIIVFFLRRGLRESRQFTNLSQIRKLKKDGDREAAAALATAEELDPNAKAPLREIFSRRNRRNTIALTVSYAFNWFGVQAFSVLATTVLTSVKGLSIGEAALFLTISNIVAAGGYLFFGWAGDRFGRRRLIAIGWVGCAIAFALVLMLPTPLWLSLILYSLGLFGILGPAAALYFYIAELYTTDCRATAETFVLAISQPGAVISNLLISLLIAAGIATNLSFLIIGGVAAFLSGFIILFAQKSAKPASISRPLPEIIR